jgi:hypothetical protein
LTQICGRRNAAGVGVFGENVLGSNVLNPVFQFNSGNPGLLCGEFGSIFDF